jgi:hypothetical protein
MIPSNRRHAISRSLTISIALIFTAACTPSPEGKAPTDRATKMPAPKPTAQSREQIFARLAGSFVASKTYPSGAMVFYAPPKAYGSWLCRVDKVTIPEWIAQGRPKTDSEQWEDDIEIDTYYAAWRSPAEGSDEGRVDACSKFRDFDRLFYDEDGGAGRYIFLLDRLLRDLGKGRANYKVACLDRRESRAGKLCDPKSVAKTLSIYKLQVGQMMSEKETANSYLRTDLLGFRLGTTHGHPLHLSLTIDSEQHFGRQSMDEGDILSAKFELEVL